MAAPARLIPGRTSLLVIDVQEKLIPLIHERERLLVNIEFLLDVAALIDVPVHVTEQYPQGLGPTVPSLSAKLPAARPAKKAFSCCGSARLLESLDSHRPWLLLAGMETHVCVSQTALDLLERGFQVALAIDAISARMPADHAVALERLRGAGCLLTTAEAVGFEWLATAEHPRFKEFSRLVQDRARRIAGLPA